MSFLKKLFGGGAGGSQSGGKFDAVEHEGYVIVPQPQAEGSQWRLCAVISREIDGEMREHKLVRADLLSSANEAADFSVQKAKQMIKEQGDKLFG